MEGAAVEREIAAERPDRSHHRALHRGYHAVRGASLGR